MNKKRSRLEVIRDILKVISERADKTGGVKPTHILYKSNLSYQMMDEYLSELKQKEFVLEKQTKEGKRFCITPKGSKFLQEYQTVAGFMNSFGLG
jgi:predicted transcriptional regulator